MLFLDPSALAKRYLFLTFDERQAAAARDMGLELATA